VPLLDSNHSQDGSRPQADQHSVRPASFVRTESPFRTMEENICVLLGIGSDLTLMRPPEARPVRRVLAQTGPVAAARHEQSMLH